MRVMKLLFTLVSSALCVVVASFSEYQCQHFRNLSEVDSGCKWQENHIVKFQPENSSIYYMTNEKPLDKKFQPFFPLSFLDGHRDGRFYKDIVVSSKKRHRLLLNCFKQFTYFAAENNLTYWLVHGALIGWFWNELLLPWDMDLDIMVLHYDLAHIYKKFDKFVYNDRYLFEINPNSQYREFQVTDVIDARFIDKLSGLYIDITAASYDPARKELHCKSPHYYAVDDIFPIRKANFSHVETWVPNKSLVMLEKDYGQGLHDQQGVRER